MLSPQTHSKSPHKSVLYVSAANVSARISRRGHAFDWHHRPSIRAHHQVQLVQRPEMMLFWCSLHLPSKAGMPLTTICFAKHHPGESLEENGLHHWALSNLARRPPEFQSASAVVLVWNEGQILCHPALSPASRGVTYCLSAGSFLSPSKTDYQAVKRQTWRLFGLRRRVSVPAVFTSPRSSNMPMSVPLKRHRARSSNDLRSRWSN